MNNYVSIFIDNEYPTFIDKYLNTKTLKRLKYITQFCGCDYTNLYNPLFMYTRFDHSLVVAHMTWHFTHDKKETIAALFHDVGTPCFAHTIDYVLGDYLNQESSEKDIILMMKEDLELLTYFKEDNINIEELDKYENFHILENKSPRLCTDRLDGVLHTCYVWLNTNSLKEIKEVYDNIVILKNEDNVNELGFTNIDIALKFVKMVFTYAKELQGNRDKYVMQFVADSVLLAIKKRLITLDDLYIKTEKEICDIFKNNFTSWTLFNNASVLIRSDKPSSNFCISCKTKKRNVIPLIKINDSIKRIDKVNDEAKNIYDEFNSYEDSKYAYVETIKECG